MVVPEQFREEMALRFEHPNSVATLFGTNIQVGPTRIQIDRAEVIELSATMKRFNEAKIGTAVPFSFRPLVPVRFERLAAPEHSRGE